VIDFGADRQCSWCGHLLHAEPCTRIIQTGSGKTPTTKPCPCAKRTEGKK
jgi:hypothetical protein